LIPAIETHESPREAYKVTLKLLRQHPHLDGIYINTASSPPVIAAISETGKGAQVKVIATDFSLEIAKSIESG
jgi:LacI family transcriptional regulator